MLGVIFRHLARQILACFTLHEPHSPRLCLYCSSSAVYCRTYVSLVQHCFGSAGAHVVLGFIAFTTVGGLAAYTIFMSQTLASLVPSIPAIGWAAIITIAAWPLCLTDNGAFLAWASLLGNVGVALVVAIILAAPAYLQPRPRIGDIGPGGEYTLLDGSGAIAAFGCVGFLFATSRSIITIQRSAAVKGAPFFRISILSTIFTFIVCGAFAVSTPVVVDVVVVGCICSPIVMSLFAQSACYSARCTSDSLLLSPSCSFRR